MNRICIPNNSEKLFDCLERNENILVCEKRLKLFLDLILKICEESFNRKFISSYSTRAIEL